MIDFEYALRYNLVNDRRQKSEKESEFFVEVSYFKE